MSTADEVNVEQAAHPGDNVGAESEASAASVDVPSSVPQVRVGPKQVQDHRRVRRVVQWAFQAAQLIDSLEQRRKSSVHAQDSSTNQGTDGHPAKWLLKGVVERAAVAALALGMEPVMEVDRLGLVVATQQEEVLRVLYLIGKQ